MKGVWQPVRLGDVCEFKGGGTPSKGVARFWQGDIPWVSPKDVKTQIVLDSIDHITMGAVSESTTSMIESGSVLMVVRSGILARTVPIAVAGRPLAINQDLKALCPKASIDSWFLYYLLEAKQPELLSLVSRGATVHRLITDHIRAIGFLLPPLSEQRRIVAVLDEAFEGIATAKANAEKNLQNARELFDSRALALLGASEQWERVQLAELLERGWITGHLDGNHGSDYPRKEEFVDAGVTYIAASAIKDGEVDFSEAKYLTPERARSIRKGLAKNRDVLFAHNATVGPVAVLDTDEEVVILGTSLTYYRCNPERIQPEYLAQFMLSPAFTSQYEQVMKQSTRNQVPITKQREFFLAIPPLDVQREITAELEQLSVQTKLLTGIYSRKLAALDELKQSLLHQAFSGAL